jgi:predicted O-linked N-acetylglucosamine transferase (SPINDLY family)
MLRIGELFEAKNHHKKAVEAYENLLLFDTKNIEATIRIGIIYYGIGNLQQALSFFEKTLQIKNDYSEAFYRLARCKNDLAIWDDWEETRSILIETIKRDLNNKTPLVCSPFDMHYYDIPDNLQFEIMQNIQKKYINKTPNEFNFKNRHHKKIRIAYLSPDFRQHALGMTVYKMFEHHQRDQFEVYAFSQYIPNENDEFHCKIKNTVDHFFNIQNLDEKASAQLIYENEIDILIDLGGYSRQTKPGILALKPAPIQIFMFGQPDTTAMPHVDYFISDKNLIDDVNRKYYTENILYLPYGFFCSLIAPSEKTITRADFGISENAFVFCSFCSPYKYEPLMFGIWMKILKKIENSVLWLMSNGNEMFENNIRNHAKQYDIDPVRIIFAHHAPIADHLKRMSICDLFLDTHFYSSCSSASHALMVGLPVLTRKGNTNASRQGASVCHAVGMDETICESLFEYYHKAIELASSKPKLENLKKQLSQNQESIPHFNLSYNIKKLEDAYSKIWDLYNNEENLTDFDIF